MPVRGRRADPGRARRIGKGKAARSLLGNQVERGADQCLAQIAVVIAAAPGRPDRLSTSSWETLYKRGANRKTGPT